MKKIIFIFIFVILLLFPSVVKAQDNTDEDFIIDVLIFVSDGDFEDLSEEQVTTEDDLEELLEELRKLASIPEEERSISDWKRIIQIVLIISSSSFQVSDEYYTKMLEYITKAKKLAKKNQDLIMENEKLIQENQELIKENEILLNENEKLTLQNQELITELGLLKSNYENTIDNLLLIIDELENTIPHYNIITLSPSINLTGQIGLGVGYLTNISWFTIGGGINLYFRPFNLGFYLSLGISF